MQGPEGVRSEQGSRQLLYGICFLEEVPLPFTAILWQEGCSWRGRLDAWRNEPIRSKDSKRAALLNVINDEYIRRELQFTLYDTTTRRELKFTFEKTALDGGWIGTCAYLHQPESTYLARCKMMSLAENWFDRTSLLKEVQARTKLKQTLASHRPMSRAEDARIIHGSYSLMPKQVSDCYASTFGSAEIEAAAERLVAYCRQRQTNDGLGSWDPFSRVEFEQFCVAEKLRNCFQLGWLDGLLDPIRDYSTYGGGYVVVQPDGLIGITERFVQRLIHKLQKTA